MTNKPTIATLLDLTKDDMNRVNGHINTHMQSDIPLIPLLANHLISAGGKRVRPLLTIAAARACNTESDQMDAVALFACCIEFIHTATLLHDDVIDESDLRRGKESAHTIWGNQATVLVGDFLFSKAFQMMAFANEPIATQQLAKASATLAEGEILQLQTTNDLTTPMDIYLKMIQSKTAVLFATATQVGGIIAKQPQSICDALYDFGEKLGTAFQIIDDALDYKQSAQEMGKNNGDDFKEGKVTLPVLYILQNATPSEKEFLHRTISEKQQTESDFVTMLDLINKYNAVEHSYAIAKNYINDAKKLLDVLEDSPYKSALLETADFTVERTL